MSDSESLDYLQPGFDPWSLTMPRLRSILVTHDVQYPATAKKAQLVEIFNENIVPRSRKILAARARAKRSSKGIVDADSQPDSQETIVAAPSVISDSELMPPPPRSTRKPSSRRAESEESSAAGSTSAALHGSPTKKKTSSRSRQRASAATSDTDTAPPTDGDYGGGALAPPPTSTRKRGRPKKSEVSVRTTDDEDDEILKRSFESSAADSVFSSDNPFQSGSSPPPVVVPFKSPSAASSRRKTTGVDVAGGRDTTISAKVKGSDRRRTDVGLSSGGHGTVERKVSKTIAAPVSRTKTAESKVKPELVEAGEEFTPEEQMDLARQPGGRDAGKEVAKRTKRKKSGGIGLGNAFLILLGALLTAYAAWYRQEKIAVGYCGVGRPATQVIPPEYEDKVPVWLKKLVEPECEVCPPHAYCSSGFVAECEPDYVLRPHPLSLFGIVPLPPTCEPDGEKVRRVKAVADKAVEELRERRAKFECGELVDADGKPEDSPAIDADDLKEVVSSKRSRRMSKQEFDDLWAAAIGDITSRDEVEVEVQQPPQPPANE